MLFNTSKGGSTKSRREAGNHKHKLIYQVEIDPVSLERVEYASLKTCEEKFGLHAERLKHLCRDGIVHSKKLGGTRQSQRLYNCDDIRDWLASEEASNVS